MSQTYILKNEDGTVAKQVVYLGDQNLLDQLAAFQAINGISFGDNLHDALADIINKLIDNGAKYV